MYNKLNLDTIKTFQRSWYHIIKHDYHDFVGSLGWMYWWLGFYFRCLGMHFMFCRNIRQRFRFSSSIKPIAHLQGVSFNYRLWFKLAWVCTTECALIHSFGANPKQSFVCAGVSTCSMCSAGSYADATGLMLWYRNIENRLSSTVFAMMWGISSNFYVAQSSHDVKIIFVNPTPLLTIKHYTKLFLLLLFLIYPKRLQPAAALDESSIWPSATGATTCIPCPTGSYNNSGGTCDLNTALTPSIQSHSLYSHSQPHTGDQAGSAHSIKAQAFPIPSERGGSGLQS